jgi:uncharacterized membrane protein YhaH (DUF805 family)
MAFGSFVEEDAMASSGHMRRRQASCKAAGAAEPMCVTFVSRTKKTKAALREFGEPDARLTHPSKEKTMKWYLAVLKNYVGFSGRAHRSEFWFYMLFTLIVSIVLAIVDSLGTVFLGAIYALATLLPGIAVTARRLHDTSRSGWWMLISLIPLIGTIILIVFCVGDTKPETNKWGPPPTPA